MQIIQFINNQTLAFLLVTNNGTMQFVLILSLQVKIIMRSVKNTKLFYMQILVINNILILSIGCVHLINLNINTK
ncbi:hypothetical protein JCM15579A_36650 [Marinifilum fragile]